MTRRAGGVTRLPPAAVRVGVLAAVLAAVLSGCLPWVLPSPTAEPTATPSRELPSPTIEIPPPIR